MTGNDRVLASDDEDAALAALRFSMAEDIVELVVLTDDDTFLGTLREALGSTRRLWHIPTAHKASDLLLAGSVGILVLDAAALNQAPEDFVGHIKRQFPDLVILVAGQRDAETALAGLISAGAVYRFIHKPLSPGRARLFTDAAVKKFQEQRRQIISPAPGPAKARSHRALWMGAAVVGAAAAGAWLAQQPAAPPTLPKTALDNAPVPNASAAAQVPASSEAGAALARARERLISALAPVSTKPAAKPAAEPAQSAVSAVAKVDSRGIAALLALAADRLGDSRLIEPPSDSAKHYIEEALRLDPNNDEGGEAERVLALRLLAEAHTAIDRRDFVHATQWLDAAQDIASVANVDAARRQLDDARNQAQADARAALLAKKWLDDPPGPSSASGNSASQTDVVAASTLELLKLVKPSYPSGAQRGRIEGWVELDFTVNQQGAAQDIAVHAASHPGVFESAAMRALAQWRYRAVVRDGQPVAQRARVRIRFTLAP